MVGEIGDVTVVILAGGRGARFDHESQVRPKPMIEVAGKPILEHIIDSLAAQGLRRFIVAVGYLGDQIVAHFLHHHEYRLISNGPDGHVFSHHVTPWTVVVADTGLDSHTGERLMRLSPWLKQRFVLTYGDGLSDVSMRRVLDQHDYNVMIKKDGFYGPAYPEAPVVTVTAVHPPGRFGRITMTDPTTAPNHRDLVSDFSEKPAEGLINGGFMVMEPGFLGYLDLGCGCCIEPIETIGLPCAAEAGRMQAYVHEGYWRCMDTRRDLEQIEEDVRRSGGKLPWMR